MPNCSSLLTNDFHINGEQRLTVLFQAGDPCDEVRSAWHDGPLPGGRSGAEGS